MVKSFEHQIDRSVVAVHEAGHLLVALASPFRAYISKVHLLKNENQWTGACILDRTELTPPDYRSIDPNGHWEHALSIGGPLAQGRCFPASYPAELTALIGREGSLLKAVANVVASTPDMKIHWWEDMAEWIGVVKHGQRLQSAGIEYPREREFLQVEAAVQAFFDDPVAASLLLYFADWLDCEEELNRDEILQVPLNRLPEICMPKDS